MNNWNELENQLRSWTPRAPSEKVKARLFGAGAAAADARAFAGHPTWHWLAPAMAMFVLCAFAVGRQPGVLAQFSMREPERDSHYANNSVQVTTFNWTNAGHSPTTTPPVSRTNTLIQ